MHGASEAPSTASMPSSRPPDAAAISSPRRTARRRPADLVERPGGDERAQLAERVPGERDGLQDRERSSQPAMLAQKIAGWA